MEMGKPCLIRIVGNYIHRKPVVLNHEHASDWISVMKVSTGAVTTATTTSSSSLICSMTLGDSINEIIVLILCFSSW
jgi:hypothetical protein